MKISLGKASGNVMRTSAAVMVQLVCNDGALYIYIPDAHEGYVFPELLRPDEKDATSAKERLFHTSSCIKY